MLEWTEYVKILVAILVIVNPLGAVPLFISLTTNIPPADRRRIPNTTSLSIAVVLVGSALAILRSRPSASDLFPCR